MSDEQTNPEAEVEAHGPGPRPDDLRGEDVRGEAHPDEEPDVEAHGPGPRPDDLRGEDVRGE